MPPTITAQSLAEHAKEISNEELYAFLLLNLRRLRQQSLGVNTSLRVPEDREIKNMKASSSKAIKYLIGLRSLIGSQNSLDGHINAMLTARKNISGQLDDATVEERQAPANVRSALRDALINNDLTEDEYDLLNSLKGENDDVLGEGLANLRAVMTDKRKRQADADINERQRQKRREAGPEADADPGKRSREDGDGDGQDTKVPRTGGPAVEPAVELQEDHTVPAEVDPKGKVVGGSETIEATVDGNAPEPESGVNEMEVDDGDEGPADDAEPAEADVREVRDMQDTLNDSQQEATQRPSRAFNKKPIHVDALGLFFGSATKPDWDTTLFQERKERFKSMKLETIATELYEQSKLIVDKFGPDILVKELVYDLDEDPKTVIRENLEVVQLYFSMKRGMAKGPRVPSAKVRVEDLVKLMGSTTLEDGPPAHTPTQSASRSSSTPSAPTDSKPDATQDQVQEKTLMEKALLGSAKPREERKYWGHENLDIAKSIRVSDRTHGPLRPQVGAYAQRSAQRKFFADVKLPTDINGPSKATLPTSSEEICSILVK